MVFPERPSDQEAKRRMAVNGYSTVKESEASAIDNKDDDNRFFSTPGILFITNLSHKGKRSTKKFTSPYSGTCARHFDVVVLTCGHLDSGLYCTTMRDHTRLCLTKHNVTVLPHPPYSPDLSPCDFFCFHD